MSDSSSSSSFFPAGSFSKQWSDIELVQVRSHNVLYTATRYGRRYMLKALRADMRQLTEYIQQQEKEFRLGVTVNHPNIAATYSLEDITVPDSLNGQGFHKVQCIVQEYIDGWTLNEWLATKPSVSARERILNQLLDALDYLHGLQLVHHDLKSGNLLITRNGQNLKIIDFGLSDTDDSVSARDNDVRNDIIKLALIIKRIFPHRYNLIVKYCEKGRYPNIAALRKDLQKSKTIIRTIPIVLLSLLLLIFVVVLYQSYQRQQQAMATIAQTKDELSMTQRELEQTKAELEAGIDSAEICRVIDDLYQPLHDSLQLPDWQYREIASRGMTAMNINPMIPFDSIASRYETGSPQYTMFATTWTMTLTRVANEYINRINSLPFYKSMSLPQTEKERLDNVEKAKIDVLLHPLRDFDAE